MQVDKVSNADIVTGWALANALGLEEELNAESTAKAVPGYLMTLVTDAPKWSNGHEPLVCSHPAAAQHTCAFTNPRKHRLPGE